MCIDFAFEADNDEIWRYRDGVWSIVERTVGETFDDVLARIQDESNV